ncbi:MAG: threonine/serine dehydratase [Alphaproteobacteria bacterium]|jgi:threonine dehydratase|nr:threonine/serine dehydratase [Alphaproteobacteria bacterium]
MSQTPLLPQTPEGALQIDIATIEAAANRIRPHIFKTPLLESPRLNDFLGFRLLIKAEALQHTGSFKLRGATNAVWSLGDEVRHVVAFSSGNHAQGVARAVTTRGINATIIMPADTPATKIEGTKAYGAEVVTYDRYSESREDIGAALSQKLNADLIKPYDDVRVIAGQGTVGLEIARQAAAMGIVPDALLCCCGGGGLIAGTSIALHAHFPDTKIWCAEPEFYDDTKRSLESGERQRAQTEKTSICDAIVTPEPGVLTFPINRTHLSGGAVVSDEHVLKTVATLFKHLKIIVEPGGAVAVAAALTGQIPKDAQTIVAVASGGNIDADMFKRALDAKPFF